MANAANFLSGLPRRPLKTSIRFAVPGGVIKIGYTHDKVLPLAQRNDGTSTSPELLQALLSITNHVTFTVKSSETKNKEVKLTVSAEEAVEILGGQVPNEANFTRICRRIMDRKNHGPTPAPTEAAEKSFGAQGQTKKPGSHSQDKHK